MIIPAYGSATIADLLPSLGAHLGVPGCREDVLGLPNAERYVVVLVDGLGWHLVRGAIRDAPYLASLLGDGKPITAGVPSTTVTSLASLGTGLPPGQHGMAGYTTRVPSTGEILNALTWESDLVARAYQPKPTLFERAVEAGVRRQLGGPGEIRVQRADRGGAAGTGVRRVRRRTRDRPPDRADGGGRAAGGAVAGLRLRAGAGPHRARRGVRLAHSG